MTKTMKPADNVYSIFRGGPGSRRLARVINVSGVPPGDSRTLLKSCASLNCLLVTLWLLIFIAHSEFIGTHLEHQAEDLDFGYEPF
jgi:hypothetical protein